MIWFKKISAWLLIFIISIPASFAQSSPQQEVQALQNCIDTRLQYIVSELEKIEGHPIELTSADRLSYAKEILNSLLLSYEYGRVENLNNAGYNSAIAAVSAVGLIKALRDNKKAKIAIQSLERNYKTVRLNAVELIASGGEDAIMSDIAFYRKALRITKVLQGTFLFVTVVAGAVALASLSNVGLQEIYLYRGDESLSKLKQASTEYDFGRILQSDKMIITQIRHDALTSCRDESDEQLTWFFKSLIKSKSPEQVQEMKTFFEIMQAAE